jgi:hypothetical protein
MTARWWSPPWRGPKFAAVVVILAALAGTAALEPGEFVAGSFILTQKALDEAPYRYSTFLTEVARVRVRVRHATPSSAIIRILALFILFYL